MKYEIKTTDIFNKWAGKLKDKRAAQNIALRLARARNGNLGDIASVGDGISEMRIFIGKGYRLYFTIRGGEIILLLCGGDKSSQQKDIKQAKEIVKLI
ncbi:MAG: putative addiction module killer protein [Phenylobacterium sp.]|jgi:putative addiction module killer protein